MMTFSAGAASLEHIAQEAGDISGVAHADAEALFGGVHGLEDGGSLVVLLEVTGGAIVQMQDDAAAACFMKRFLSKYSMRSIINTSVIRKVCKTFTKALWVGVRAASRP
jgi:hypothetical protein